MWPVFNQAHHIRHYHGAFLRNHEYYVCVVFVFSPIRIEIVIEQNGGFARWYSRVRRLLGHDGVILHQLLEIVYGRREIIQAAAQSTVLLRKEDTSPAR